ncbi:MAG: 2Fe-2S iron-sulfur cluster-binding protein [Gemmatimonadota bacterium]|nr:2Fe-2S iron-sulfur cluster-binding protein [Gemmatimonadota bacterium]
MADSPPHVTLTIEGAQVTVPKGTMILEAAKQAGVLIPHYCYHPGLPVAGVCRMCLVQVDGLPKLQIACATPVAEGQVVRVFEPEAVEARKGVLEFLLINHPLDCPICDQAGECELQDYVFREGRATTRYTPTFAKRYNPAEEFGPDVLYVPNRCILCTRCVRFMDHAAGEPVLNVSERGDRAFIGIHPDRELDHPWAGNVVDLCPVGSLISRDFLHKARAWELDKTASVCTGCSQGCNVAIETRQNTVVRLRPRSNEAVNRYFMCDHGRLHYRWLNQGDRIDVPLVRQDGTLVAADWDEAIHQAAELLAGAGGEIVVLASPRASTEALFLARAIAGDGFRGAFRVERFPEDHPLPGVPDLALRGERAPNVRGAVTLGYAERFAEQIAQLGKATVVVILGEDLDGLAADALAGVPHVIHVGTTLPEAARGAAVVLPATTVAEEEGTFVNRDGRVQRYLQARSGPGMARPAWWALGEILAELGRGEPLGSSAEAFALLAAEVEAFAGLSYDGLGLRGAMLHARAPAGASA